MYAGILFRIWWDSKDVWQVADAIIILVQQLGIIYSLRIDVSEIFFRFFIYYVR